MVLCGLLMFRHFILNLSTFVHSEKGCKYELYTKLSTLSTFFVFIHMNGRFGDCDKMWENGKIIREVVDICIVRQLC